jgi:hypothetical protein
MASSDTIPEFISQRRRWLNGAFFAAVYSLVNGKQLWKTDHSVPRKILLQIEAVYQFLNLLFTYFGLVCGIVLLTEKVLTIRRRTSTWLSFSLQDLYQTIRLIHSDTTWGNTSSLSCGTPVSWLCACNSSFRWVIDHKGECPDYPAMKEHVANIPEEQRSFTCRASLSIV